MIILTVICSYSLTLDIWSKICLRFFRDDLRLAIEIFREMYKTGMVLAAYLSHNVILVSLLVFSMTTMKKRTNSSYKAVHCTKKIESSSESVHSFMNFFPDLSPHLLDEGVKLRAAGVKENFISI